MVIIVPDSISLSVSEKADRLSERVLVSTVREVVFIAKTIPPPARAVAIGSWKVMSVWWEERRKHRTLTACLYFPHTPKAQWSVI